MIPLRDNIAHRKLPLITVALLLANIAVFIYELSLGPGVEAFVSRFGFIPKEILKDSLDLARFVPFATSMFLHGGVMHLVGNMLFLWIFADNVEDRMGHMNFLVFYLLCGIIASGIHLLMNARSAVPAVGASGAIAGVLGAYILLFPRARIVTLIPFFIFWQIVEIPAFIFLGIWFLYQLLLGLGSAGGYGTDIAFWAHIGGFIAGLFFVRLFTGSRRVRV